MQSLTIADCLIILATLLSPFLAVQSQKWIERATARSGAKKKIFHDLMGTRAHPLRVHQTHVQALNMIDVEFQGKPWHARNKLDAEVIARWKIYASHLGLEVDDKNEAAVLAWNVKGDDLFVDLLFAMSRALGYTFDRVTLAQGVYYPRAHGIAERKREIAEGLLLQVLAGKQPLAMSIKDFPVNEEAADLQVKAYRAFAESVDKDGAIRVKRAGAAT